MYSDDVGRLVAAGGDGGTAIGVDPAVAGIPPLRSLQFDRRRAAVAGTADAAARRARRLPYRSQCRLIAACTIALDAAALLVAFWAAGAGVAMWPVALAWVLSLAAHGLYDRTRLVTYPDEAGRLVHAAAVASTLTVLLGAFGVTRFRPESVMVLCGVALSVAAAQRLGLRAALRQLQGKGFLLRRTLVVGINDEARLIGRTLGRQHWLGYEPAGYVTTGEIPGACDLPVVGTLADLPDAVRTAGADSVVLASTALDPGSLPELYATLQALDVDVRLSAGLPQVAASRFTVEPLDGLAVLAVKRNELSAQQRSLKRVTDAAASVALLVVVAPVMALVALAVRLTSAGPVIFRQVRVGEGGEPFVIYKFRTMVVGAEHDRHTIIDLNEADGPLFKVVNDPRLTPVGKFLRRFGLDELPQLWNVVRGEMSLVGPRPPLPEETHRYDEWVKGRLRVKPGITGLWQISGRHELSFADYVRYDLFYIENWSALSDIYILLRTIPVLFSNRGAA